MIQTIGLYVAGIAGILFLAGLAIQLVALPVCGILAWRESRHKGLGRPPVSMAPQKDDGHLTGLVS